MFGYAAFSQAPFAALGGGVEFNRAVTESGAATEAIAALASFVPSLSTSAAAADATAVAPSIFNAYAQDTVLGSQTVSALAEMYSLSIGRSTVTDAPTAIGSFNVYVAEDAYGVDATPLLTVDYVGSVSVLATILDSAIGGLSYSVFVQATATGADASAAAQGHGVSLSDTATITDSSAALQGFAVVTSDTTTITDASSSLADLTASVSPTANALDAVAALAVFYAALTNHAVGADAVAQRLLWEIINDSQTANWQNISSAQATGWSNIEINGGDPWGNIPTEP